MAIRSGWIAPAGPDLDAFEAEMSQFTSIGHAVALSSGTAALHLGLKALGVKHGDEVIVPTLTFGATAFAAVHAGAQPVFLDVEETSWNMDPQLLSEVLAKKARTKSRIAALVPVDLFGRTCDYEAISAIAHEYGIPILEDAAEALGAHHGAAAAGSFGRAGVFSFNGNKIMTTSGGGMLVSHDPEVVNRVRYWANQSREPQLWFEHEEIGYNYRLSNILAALGRAQLVRLPAMIQRRREIRNRYEANFFEVGGISVVTDPPWGTGNSWLTNVRFDLTQFPNAPEAVLAHLGNSRIEARHVWKPMHLQPVFVESESHLTGAADRIFADGLCLPSGPMMTDDDVDLVSELVVRGLNTRR
jgi:dTDP-4-amino-4,6-dideoxygalactose transaminase